MDYVLHHGNCFDGFGAAWALEQGIGKAFKHTYIPVMYGKPMPELPNAKNVYILDFSYSKPILEKLASQVTQLKVIDHHKTAEEDLKGLPFCTFDLNHSGAVLSWKAFNKGPVPKLLAYIEDRDLWKFALPNSKAINAWIQSYPQTFAAWDEMNKEIEKEGIVKEGEAILRDQTGRVAQAVKHYRWEFIGNYKVPIVNTSLFMSEVANLLLEQHPEVPFAGYKFLREDGKWQYGLRSRKDFDCSAIARLVGGGGHPQASGFTLAT
jgi:oligoribonuclease NrnB/cAMP/cGMP phosphodiesterase (DHH superfamily)